MKVKKIVLFWLASTVLFSCCPVRSVSAPTKTPTTIPVISPGEIITVTSAADSGPGTLRQALLDVQDDDTIFFDPVVFSPDDPVTIQFLSALPFIEVDRLTLDGSNAGIILDGSQIPEEWVPGLQIISSEDSKIMGLHISKFPGSGIAISGGSSHNIIGGDRNTGSGPFGQGNLFSNNVIGIDLSSSGTSFNIITGNLIGIDLAESDWLGNIREGVWISESAHDNTVGPDNIIANNGSLGVLLEESGALNNVIVNNSIFDNGVGKGTPLYPVIYEFNLATGTAAGATCAGCTVEIFSTSTYEGEIFEDTVTADANGIFTVSKGSPFSGPYLTARTTSQNGMTSNFSISTSGTEGSLVLQKGNNELMTRFISSQSMDLDENHIGTHFDSFGIEDERYDLGIYKWGVKRARVAITGTEPVVDWIVPEFSIAPKHDDVFTRMADNGLSIVYMLTFWDKETFPSNDDVPCPRFKSKEEIENFLEFVRFTVEHFKDRVEYYEIWNEPDVQNLCPKYIESEDYIELVRSTVPVIREVYPEAKIVVGSVSKTYYPDAYNYLLEVLKSDIMPLVDVVAWHPMYGESPEDPETADYYYAYPEMVNEIMETAAANGFVGTYHADELSWLTSAVGGSSKAYSLVVANKYFSRSALMHLGLGIDIVATGPYFILGNLCTTMSGVEPVDLPIEIQSKTKTIESATFSLPEGGYLVALWTDGIAVEVDPGVETSLTIPEIYAGEATVVDILNGVEQDLIFNNVGGSLIIEDLLVKDYPILIKIVN
ncbi:MAG: hypothetical protein JEZ06_04045 [Anaerolineaceae bacterium]|nr:hypothetical protein [Anaerolineaceae bacterium]